ncbi:MAG: hypothetical protein COA73_01270 [Candidatus Hydrogenedentota bacterium]|nr:MAG: hypothetical protein COA73_01270 [Candidatus Hydrogenedentota bacterium]
MRSHVLLFLMCLSSSVLGSVFTISMQKADAEEKEVPKTIEAQEFRLVDANGNTRGRFGFSGSKEDQRPYLSLNKVGGHQMLSVAIDKDGMPFIRLNNPEMPPTAIRQRGGTDRRFKSNERIPYSDRTKQTDD